MDKPKELTGRVMPFLEYVSSNLNRAGRLPLKKLVNFYSQPFTPEMLDCFEGWTRDEVCNFEYGYGDSGIGMRVLSESINNPEKHIYLVDNNDCEENTWEVKTLNDFITLCTLAGIELKWKS